MIVLKPSNTDLQKLKICADTEIEISETTYRVTGGLLEYFQNNVVPVFCALVEIVVSVSFAISSSFSLSCFEILTPMWTMFRPPFIFSLLDMEDWKEGLFNAVQRF